MTSLITGSGPAQRDDADDPRHRRPLVLVAALGGAAAAGATLVVCLGLGVVGWFLSDAGAHGTSSDGLRVGALGWLMAHGSGVHVGGVPVTAVPLALTVVCAWATWRFGYGVGESVSGHGPDADRIADGERDWTVPAAGTVFTLGYVAVVLVALRIAALPGADPSGARSVFWSVLLCATFGAGAIAVGSGRAAIWTTFLPPSLRAAAATCVRIVLTFLAVSAAVLLVSFVLNLSTAANVMSRLHTNAGAATLYILLTVCVLPNAAVFSGSYLLGPGFAVGVHTVVSPSLVSLGAVPMFPLLAALPGDGPTPVWTPYLLVLPPLVAAVAAARAQRRNPVLRWDAGALRGCAGGVLAGVVVGFLAMISGGSVGPGRMQQVGPFAFDVLVHAITAFGIGGLLGGLAMTWWQRRAARADAA